jgi:hypothetical protein
MQPTKKVATQKSQQPSNPQNAKHENNQFEWWGASLMAKAAMEDLP